MSDEFDQDDDEWGDIRRCIFEAVSPAVRQISLSGASSSMIAAALIDMAASFSMMALTNGGTQPSHDAAMNRTAASFRALLSRYSLLYATDLDELEPGRSGFYN